MESIKRFITNEDTPAQEPFDMPESLDRAEIAAGWQRCWWSSLYQ